MNFIPFLTYRKLASCYQQATEAGIGGLYVKYYNQGCGGQETEGGGLHLGMQSLCCW